MYRRKRQITEIPKLKISKTRGAIGYELLEIIDEKPFRKVSEVRKAFKPIVIDDKRQRAKASPKLWKSFQRLISNPESEEKLFDTEYCAVRGYLEAFDFVAPLGPRADEQITLTYFGSKLLKLCRENNTKNIFDDSTKRFRARVYLFVDNIRGWNFVKIIEKRGPIMFDDFCDLLLQYQIGLNHEKIRRDIAAKPDFRKMLAKEWRRTHRLAPIDHKWKERRIEEYAKVEAREDNYVMALLSLYVDIGLLSKDDKLLYANTTYLKRLREERFWMTSEEIDKVLFFSKMYEIYKELSARSGVMSVPIPVLRKATCLKLDMPWYSFDALLRRFPRGVNKYEITMTRGSSARRLDLSINSEHFYYIQFKKL